MQTLTTLALLWISYCVLHSVLADIGVKKWIAAKLGAGFKYYRLYYTLFAFVGLVGVILYQISIDPTYVYVPTLFTKIVGAIIGIIGLIIMGICIKKYFAQLSGLKTLFQNEVKTGNTLLITGIHRYVRHPLYLGTFMFIWGIFIFVPYTSLLISNFIITVYTLIGIRFEEQKLIREFGESYIRYRNSVPKIIPAIKPLPAD
jgi:protein-S-isoprenylcysteine O-methyltransferase Ste14